jgi:hypothetical protein
MDFASELFGKTLDFSATAARPFRSADAPDQLTSAAYRRQWSRTTTCPRGAAQ